MGGAMHIIDKAPSSDAPRGSAVERLIANIQRMISDRNLAFGDALPTERELGLMLGASRNTVREALQYLRAYGVIDIKPKTGAVLTNRQSHAVDRLMTLHHAISPASFREVQGFRKVVETAAGEIVLLRAAQSDLDALDAANRRVRESVGAEEAAVNDFVFHDLLVQLAGNSVLHASYLSQRNAMLEIMRIGKGNRPIHDATYTAHQEIIDALRARDRLAFSYLLSRHLDFGLRFIEAKDGLSEDAAGAGGVDGGV
ncbi:FadR family transcriptional regulator [Rhizobium sp. SEMIA 4032]|nr:FadR family transcriptional regulator [Rhizobium sp. SEMIA 4032]